MQQTDVIDKSGLIKLIYYLDECLTLKSKAQNNKFELMIIFSLQIPVHCERDLNLLITVTDVNGRRFDNISSLEFEWSLSDKSLATLPLGGELESDVTVTPGGRKDIVSK